MNFCNEDFEEISKDSKSYQFELDKIKSKPLLVVKSDPAIDFEPFKQLKNKSGSQLSVSINDIEQVLNAVISTSIPHEQDLQMNLGSLLITIMD